MKKSLKICFIFIFLMFLMSGIVCAEENTTYTYENLIYEINSTSGTDKIYIVGVTDYNITELRIPATIDGIEVYALSSLDTGDALIFSLPNLEAIYIGDVDTSLGYTTSNAETGFASLTNLKKIVVEQEIITRIETLGVLSYLDSSKIEIHGYAGTRVNQAAVDDGFTFKSLGQAPTFVYDSEDSTKIKGLNVNNLENIVIPSGVKNACFTEYYGGLYTTGTDSFGTDTVKKITINSKDPVIVNDIKSFANLETIEGYSGIGNEILADNNSLNFVSLGTGNNVSQFSYEIINNEYVKITGSNFVLPETLEIPSEIEGLPVKEIASGVWTYDWNRVLPTIKIIIPESVEVIGAGTFNGMNKEEIYIYNPELQFDSSNLLFFNRGYTFCFNTKVYGYEGSTAETVVNDLNADYENDTGTAVSAIFCNIEDVVVSKPVLTYATQVQNIGWQKYVNELETSGTEGKSFRLEAIKINLETDLDGEIQYTTHVQNQGWQEYVSTNEISGTVGKGLRLEGIKIRLTGALKEKYDVYYRVHVQNVGWLSWAKNDEVSGSSGYGYRLEGIQIALVEKDGEAPEMDPAPKTTEYFKEKVNVIYQTHIQNIGWQANVRNGVTSGAPGRHLRIEGIKIKKESTTEGSIRYKTHVQNKGWGTWGENGAFSGTEGLGLRTEAVMIELTGDLAEKFDVYYRIYVEDVGWLGWAKNGEEAGSTGYGKKLEGIEIRVLKKGDATAPETGNSCMNK